VSSPSGGACKIRYRDKTMDLSLEPGEKQELNEFN